MRETKSEFQANQTIQMIQSTDGKENQKKKKKVVFQLVCLHPLVTPIVGFQD